jgi:hypothetical protein
MRNMKSINPLGFAALAVAIFGFALISLPSAAAVTPSGTVNFFDASGTGASSTCTSTVWNGGTFADGNIGFGGNLGVANNIPVVSNGEEICMQLILSDQAATTTYTLNIPGGYLTPVVGSNTVMTDAAGNANVYIIYSVSGLTGDCTTHPIQISPDVGGTASTGDMIHHFYGGSGMCGGVIPFPPPPLGVPQFPLGTLGMAAMIAGLAAVLFVQKKKFGSRLQ